MAEHGYWKTYFSNNVQKYLKESCKSKRKKTDKKTILNEKEIIKSGEGDECADIFLENYEISGTAINVLLVVTPLQVLSLNIRVGCPAEKCLNCLSFD